MRNAEGSRRRCFVIATICASIRSTIRSRVPSRRLDLTEFRSDEMRREVACYATWYNQYRPHTGLEGRTPMEVYRGLSAANEAPRFEPRSRWPRKSRCASPSAPVKGKRGVQLTLILSRFENRAHLPVIELRRAA